MLEKSVTDLRKTNLFQASFIDRSCRYCKQVLEVEFIKEEPLKNLNHLYLILIACMV